MNSRAKGRRHGFALLEALIALTICSVVAGVVVAAGALNSSLFRITGSAVAAGVVHSVNPDDSVAASANALAAEFLSLTSASRFVVCADRPVSDAQARQLSQLPALDVLGTAGLRSEGYTRQVLEAYGVQFSGQGYSVWAVGANGRLNALLRVRPEPHVNVISGPTSPPEEFTVYTVELFGNYDEGFGLLFSYDFMTPTAAAQSISAPSYNGGVWTITLPDPSRPTELPNGAPLSSARTSSLVYEIVAPY